MWIIVMAVFAICGLLLDAAGIRSPPLFWLLGVVTQMVVAEFRSKPSTLK